MSQGNKLNDKWYFKKYLNDHGIKNYKNKIDILSQPKCKGLNYSDKEIARIEFADGNIYIRLGNGKEIDISKAV